MKTLYNVKSSFIECGYRLTRFGALIVQLQRRNEREREREREREKGREREKERKRERERERERKRERELYCEDFLFEMILQLRVVGFIV